jgi:hypothetical protein
MVKLAGLEDVVTITVGAFETTYTALRKSLGVNHIDVREPAGSDSHA